MEIPKNVLLIDCEDAKGLVYRITKILYQNNLSIILNREFVERESGRFFMRTVIEGVIDKDNIIKELEDVLPHGTNIRLKARQQKKVVIMATKEHHVLGDLLIRNEFGELQAHVQAVISNHQVLKPFVDKFNVPFHYIPHNGLNRREHENQILKILSDYAPHYLLLAKYMRILTPVFVERFENRIVNIHHSFLPAFAGARPYQQAYERAVKVIGATAHYVTGNLDEGPIIAQSTLNVDHTYNARGMAQAGREIECQVMAKAVNQVLDDKVFIYGHKTVILD